MAHPKEADNPVDPHKYVAVSFKTASDGSSATIDEEGTWTTVVHRLFRGKIDETRIIFDGMTEGEMRLVHKLVDDNPESAFRNGTPSE
jgi:hypothetical protein